MVPEATNCFTCLWYNIIYSQQFKGRQTPSPRLNTDWCGPSSLGLIYIAGETAGGCRTCILGLFWSLKNNCNHIKQDTGVSRGRKLDLIIPPSHPSFHVQMYTTIIKRSLWLYIRNRTGLELFITLIYILRPCYSLHESQNCLFDIIHKFAKVGICF